MTETLTCTLLSAATTYTTTLPGGGVGVYEASMTFGEVFIGIGLYLVAFSMLLIYAAERRRRS